MDATNDTITSNVDDIPFRPPPSVSAPEDDGEEALQDPREAEQRRLSKRPSIDHLHDAIVKAEDGSLVFVPDVGEYVVLERRTSCLIGNPWLDTRLLRVVAVDEVTGAVRLHDEDFKQACYSNFLTGAFHRFKLPPAKGRWDSPPPQAAPRVIQVPSSNEDSGDHPGAVPASQVGPDGQPVKRGRGRPKGSKNRPREVVQAEKAQKAEERRAKKAARMAKRK